jgi:hypothetical protein
VVSSKTKIVDRMTRACIQEIQQVADGKRDRYPNPDAGDQDTGSPDRVGCDLHSDWCKLRLGVVRARVVTIFFLFRSRAWSLLPFSSTSDSQGSLKCSCPWAYSLWCVAASRELPSNGIDLVIWLLGSLPNRRSPTRGEEPLAWLCIYFV